MFMATISGTTPKNAEWTARPLINSIFIPQGKYAIILQNTLATTGSFQLPYKYHMIYLFNVAFKHFNQNKR